MDLLKIHILLALLKASTLDTLKPHASNPF